MSILYIILGFLLLIKGGDWLVDAAVSIANRYHVPPMIIGITIMGFGTSMPELLVSAQAALAGSSGIAIGNVVGSNISNIALILGLTAILHPVPAKPATLRFDIPCMILSAVVFTAMALVGGTITRPMGIILIIMLAAFMYRQIKRPPSCRCATSSPEGEGGLHLPDNGAPATKGNSTSPSGEVPACRAERGLSPSGEDVAQRQERGRVSLWRSLLLLAISFIMLVYGADLLVDGATDVARAIGAQMGVSATRMEQIIGLTIVAVGTSLPELFASVMAARKGETDMAIGNIVGSVTFNILCVIGVSATICPIEHAADGFLFDYMAMCVLTVLLWFFLRTRYLLERWEGIVLTLLYIAYIARTVI